VGGGLQGDLGREQGKRVGEHQIQNKGKKTQKKGGIWGMKIVSKRRGGRVQGDKNVRERA